MMRRTYITVLPLTRPAATLSHVGERVFAPRLLRERGKSIATNAIRTQYQAEVTNAPHLKREAGRSCFGNQLRPRRAVGARP